MTHDNQDPPESASWQPLARGPRRVLGVLIEKAKTTPDNYPLTVASLISGCNQKSNRDPQMQMDEDDVVDALDTLRSAGAAREVQGSGRVNKYRHLAYEWLGVNGPQVAVMTELLLRGPQTAGELRARCARMEPFPDLPTLMATLGQLQSKGLVVPLSSPGRGQAFAHALYEPDEMVRLRMRHDAADAHDAAGAGTAGGPQPPRTSTSEPPPAVSPAAAAVGRSDVDARLDELLAEVRELRGRVEHLERELGLDAS